MDHKFYCPGRKQPSFCFRYNEKMIYCVQNGTQQPTVSSIHPVLKVLRILGSGAEWGRLLFWIEKKENKIFLWYLTLCWDFWDWDTLCAFKARVVIGEDEIRALLSKVKVWLDWWTCEHLANFLLGFSNDGLRVYFSVCDGRGNHT